MFETSVKWMKQPAYAWNPVTGCPRHCDDSVASCANACAASCLEKNVPVINEPVFNMENYAAGFPDQPAQEAGASSTPLTVRPAHIIVNESCDLFFWEHEWKQQILKKISEHPQHLFYILTRDLRMSRKIILPPNSLLGMVVENETRLLEYECNHISGHYNVKKTDNRLFFVIKTAAAIRISRVYYQAEWLVFDLPDDEITAAEENKHLFSVVWHYRNGRKLFMTENFQPVWAGLLIREYPEVRQEGANL